MKRTAVAALAAALVAAAAFLVPAQASSTSSRLVGEVGPGFSIEVKQGGKDVKTLKAGTYTIKVEDRSSIHDFHLFGPGVNKKTAVAFKGDTSWTVKLRHGRYTYQCDPHASAGMKDSFRVR